MQRLRNILIQWPWLLILLPVFFVLHGCVQHFYQVETWAALKLVGIYFLTALVLFVLLRLFYKNNLQAAVAAFTLLAINFFFGAFHDALKKILPGSFFIRYSFLLPLLLLLTIATFIIIKKKKEQLTSTAYYLNLLFIILIVVDTGNWIYKKINYKEPSISLPPKEFALQNVKDKPDVYLILADEYAGEKELQDIFHFSNDSFYHQLEQRGFHITKNTHSNYNYTIYSASSILNMNYHDLKGDTVAGKNLDLCNKTLYTNNSFLFLHASGYKFYNFSSENVINNPAQFPETFNPVNEKLINSQTLLNRVKKDLDYHLIINMRFQWARKSLFEKSKDYNEEKISRTIEAAKEKTKNPKFIFTHLALPHSPYYFNENGKAIENADAQEGQYNKNNYLAYLKYANKKYLQLIDAILANSKTPPVIILFSDHGFRHLTNDENKDYQFNTLNAVLLPNKNYQPFYEGMSTVNLLRVVFNAQFNQQLPLLNDNHKMAFKLE